MPYEPLHRSPEQTNVLQGLIDRCLSTAKLGQVPVAVFDLDGCLFDNRPRQIQIVREFAAQYGEYDLFRLRDDHIEDWSLDASFRAAGIPEATIERVRRPITVFWQRQFFRGRYTLYDHAMPGAPQLVWRIYQTGAHVVYLTGRDETMRHGTEESLTRFGFPFHRPRTTLILKPEFASDDAAFKTEALREIRTLGRPVAFLDNEPTNLNIFADHEPEATIVMVCTHQNPPKVETYTHNPRVTRVIK